MMQKIKFFHVLMTVAVLYDFNMILIKTEKCTSSVGVLEK